MIYCKNCGKEIADDSKFCQHCGSKVGDSSKNQKFSKIDWIATFAGLLWLAYWAKEAIGIYTSKLGDGWLYARYVEEIYKESYSQSMIKSEALGDGVSYFISYGIIPLLIAIVVYIFAPICYKKYKEHKAIKEDKK